MEDDSEQDNFACLDEIAKVLYRYQVCDHPKKGKAW